MITCNGLVVGMVTSATRQDVINMCTEFIKMHKYLIGKFDHVVHATVIDSYEDGGVYALYRTYDGRTSVGIA